FSRSVSHKFEGGKAWTGETAMNRLVAEVNWRRRFIDPLGQTYTPFFNLRGDFYSLHNVLDPVTFEPIDDEIETRGIAAAGILYAYPFVSHSATGAHVIEPIAQVIARNSSGSQRHLPDEDSRSIVFDDTNLFELNKMAGYDRVETGTRANVGLQYTYQANDGWFARVLAGQSYHLAGDNIYRDPGFVPGRQAVGRDELLLSPPYGALETLRPVALLAPYLPPSSAFRTLPQTRFDDKDFGFREPDVFGESNYGPLIP